MRIERLQPRSLAFLGFVLALACLCLATPANAQGIVFDSERPTAGWQVDAVEAVPQPAPRELPAGTPFTHIQFYPWPPVQGKTVTMWWQASDAVTVTARIGDQAFPGIAAGRQGWALLPVPPLAKVGQARLHLSTTQGSLVLPFPVAAGEFETDVVPPGTADPILAEADKVNAEAIRTTALFSGETPYGWDPSSRFHPPAIGDFEHTSPFGSRRVYGSSPVPSVHNGEDFAAPPGTPVLAPAPGTVVLAERLFVRGNAVIIDHGHGVYTGYWHMQKLDVKAGEHVETGQQLGEVGTTGLSTGPHLHWELRVHGLAADPLQWLSSTQ